MTEQISNQCYCRNVRANEVINGVHRWVCNGTNPRITKESKKRKDVSLSEVAK